MTTHTYKVIWSHDLEADSPVEAAQAFLDMALALGKQSVVHKDRPIVEVQQFIDTDKPPLCARVDTLDWSTSEEWVPGGRRIWIVTATDAVGNIEELQAYDDEEYAHQVYENLIYHYVEQQRDAMLLPDFSYRTHDELQEEYERWHEKDAQPGSITIQTMFTERRRLG